MYFLKNANLICKNGVHFRIQHSKFDKGAEVVLRTQGSRPRPRTEKNPRPRPRTTLPKTDFLQAKDRNVPGQEQGQKRKCSPKKVFKKVFQANSKKNKKRLHKNFSGAPQNFNSSKNSAVLEPRTGQYFRGLEALRPRPRTWPSRPRTSRRALEDSVSVKESYFCSWIFLSTKICWTVLFAQVILISSIKPISSSISKYKLNKMKNCGCTDTHCIKQHATFDNFNCCIVLAKWPTALFDHFRILFCKTNCALEKRNRVAFASAGQITV